MTTDFTSASLLESSLREANKQFFIKRKGFTREQLHGHRLRAAFTAIKAFVSARQEQRMTDFEDRLCTYTRLLRSEMSSYESARRANEMEKKGSYRRLKKRVTGAWKIEGAGRAAAIEQAIAASPAEYNVEEEPWLADLPLGVLRWWECIERNVEMTLENVVGCEAEDEDDEDDVPLAEVEEVARQTQDSGSVFQDTPPDVHAATRRSGSRHPSSPPPPAGEKETPRTSSPSRTKLVSQQSIGQHAAVGDLTLGESSTREGSPTSITPALKPAPVPQPRLHSRGKGGPQLPAERVTLGGSASAAEGSAGRQLRSASHALANTTPAPAHSPAPAPRSHSRGKGGQQPPAERASVGEGTSLGAAASSGQVMSENGGTTRLGGRVTRAASGPEELEVIPDDVIQLFAKLRTGSKAYQWRHPSGMGPAKMSLDGAQTVDDIRAAHTDSAGNITSYATLDEVSNLAEILGLRKVLHLFKVPCGHCRGGKLACYYWNRTSCTNCYAARTKCSGGVIPDAAVSDPHKGKKASIFEPRPERRFYLLKQLEDVMGGWDPRLNAAGEAISGSKGKTTSNGNRKTTAKKADVELTPDSSPNGDEAMDTDLPVVTNASTLLAPDVDETKAPVDGDNHMDVDDEFAPTLTLDQRIQNTPSSDVGRGSPEPAAEIVPFSESPPPSQPLAPTRGSKRCGRSIISQDASNSPVSQDTVIPSSNHPARGPRRVAEMEPVHPEPARSVLDRPRMPSMLPPFDQPAPRGGPHVPSTESANVATPAPRVHRPRMSSMPLPLDLERHDGGPYIPDLTSPEWRDLPQRFAVLERQFRDDRLSLHVKLETLTSGLLSLGTTMQSTHTMAASAADNARQTTDYLARSALHRDEILEVQRDSQDSRSSSHPRSVPEEAAPSVQIETATHRSVDVETLLEQAVSRSEERCSNTFLAQLHTFGEQGAKDRKAMKEQGAQNLREMKEQAALATSALEARVKAIEERLGSGLAALSLSAPSEPSPSSRTVEEQPRENATRGEVAAAKAVPNRAMSSEGRGHTPSAPDRPLAVGPQANSVANPHAAEAEGTVSSGFAAVQPEQEGQMFASRKRRGSHSEDGGEPSEPNKRRRSSSDIHSE